MLVLVVSGVVWVVNGVDFSQLLEVFGIQEGVIWMLKEQDWMLLNYVNQLLMILYSVEGYQVMININCCLQCYGVESYCIIGVLCISFIYFMDSDGKVGVEVVLCCYFCL